MKKVRLIRIIDRYIAEEYIFSFAVSFLFFFIVFFVNQVLLMAEDVLQKSVPLKDVTLLIVYSLPMVLQYTFPFASLVGGLMTVGRFSSDNEILAFRASGLRYVTIIKPLIVIAFIISLLSFFANDYLTPISRIEFNKLQKKILLANPEVVLEPYAVTESEDVRIITGQIKEGKISDIVIIDTSDNDTRQIMIARGGRFTDTQKDKSVASLVMDKAVLHSVPKKKRNESDFAVCDRLIYNILMYDINFNINTITPEDKNVHSLLVDMNERNEDRRLMESSRKKEGFLQQFELGLYYDQVVDDTAYYMQIKPSQLSQLNKTEERMTVFLEDSFKDSEMQTYRMVLYNKIALPLSCLVFAFFAFPVGLFAKRSGRTVGFGIGLLVAIFFWGFHVFGKMLGFRMTVDAFWAVWTPNLVVLTIGVIVYIVRLRK